MFKRKTIIISFTLFALGVFLSVIFLRQQYVAPILMYHSVSPAACVENRLTVSAVTFERQMAFLKRHGYRVVELKYLADLIAQKKHIPAKTVAITFDDGYRDNYTYAFGILKKYNFPATVFVIVHEIDRPDRLNWEEIRRMRDAGIIAFGSHALDPEPLVNLKSERELRKQIFDSKRTLEEKLAVPVNSFSYASGAFNDKIKRLVKEAGYKFAVATSPGKGFSNDDIYALKRLRISENAADLFIFWIKVSGYYNFIHEHRHR